MYAITCVCQRSQPGATSVCQCVETCLRVYQCVRQCSRCLTVCLTLCCPRLFVIAVLSQVQQVFVSVLIHACVFVSVYSEVHQVSVSIFDSVLTHVCLSVCSASAADVHQCVQPYMAGACQCVC